MAIQISDSAFRAYEEYVLKERDIDASLKGLIPGTETYNYIKCIDLLARKGLKLNNDEKAFIESYASRTNTTEARKIKLRTLLMRYDMAQSDKEKADILNEISDNFARSIYNHTKPASLNVKTMQKEEVAKKAEKNLLDEVDLNKELEKLYKGEKRVHEFSLAVLVKLDLARLKKPDFYSLIDMMGRNIVLLDSNPKFYSIYGNWLKEELDKKSYGNVHPGQFYNMTMEQLDKLAEKVPELKEQQNFVSLYFKKKFSSELSEEAKLNLNNKEKRENLITMYEYAKKLPSMLSGLKSFLLLEILENGLKIDVYDEKYFIEYLQLPVRKDYLVKPIALKIDDWKPVLYNVQSEHNRDYSSKTREADFKLFTKYLERFFTEGKPLKGFNPYFDQEFLIEIWENTQLMSGKEVDVNDRNNSRLERLGTEVKIDIMSHNKDVFLLNDDISLWVEIKNVPTLFVKVFEINGENYYREEMKPFRSDVNLDGLIASLERTINYEKSPQFRFREELKFPELKGKMGLYVIELIGNGKSSRAILRIGTISLITRQTIAGQICYILDAERKVCCDESTGMWMDNQYFKADVSQNGRIIVPYLPSNGPRHTNAVLLHKGLAQFADIQRLEENYGLSCGFYLLPESVIMGESATVMIRPQLFINGRMADIRLLKNMKCVLITHNYIEDIPVTKTYDDLKFSDKEEVLVKFQVGANLKEIRIEFSADVKNVTKDRTEKLNASHSFPIINHITDCSINDFYLRLNKNREYELHLLGKNGEPISSATVSFKFNTSLFNYPITMSETTDDQGVIKLGKLKDITTVTASLNQPQLKENLMKNWNVPSSTMIQYPWNIDVIENEVVELPVAIEQLNNSLNLVSFYNDSVLFNVSNLIKVQSEKGDLYGTVKVSGLKMGKYLLKGIGKNDINIRVHKGTYWEEDSNYILKQYSLLENTKKHGFIKIRNVNFEEAKEGKSNLKIQIESPTKDHWRVHAMLFRYLPSDLDDLTLRLLSRDNFEGSEHFFQKWNNIYLSNRELSTEFRYCFDRKQQTPLTGNTLDKPKLVLKRTLIQSTHTRKEASNAGTAYSNVREQQQQMQQNYDMVCQASLGQAVDYSAVEMNCVLPESASYQAPIPHARAMYLAGSNGASYRPTGSDVITYYQNFLGVAPLMLCNIPANSEGVLTIELPKDYEEIYACMLILAVDKGSVAHYLHPFTGAKTVKRDLTLTKALDTAKSYSEMRTTTCVNKFDSYFIEDIASADLQIIDSLEKVLLVVKELMKMYNINIKDLDKFEKLIKWETMPKEEKNKMVSRYGSHELHLFIYKKDPTYFEEVLKSHLQNKMEKTFIDYYLLGDMKSMLEFCECPIKFNELNPLEKALLTEALAKGGKLALAQTIAQSMRNSLLKIKKNVAEQNRVFDVVLSLGSLKTVKQSLERIREDVNQALSMQDECLDELSSGIQEQSAVRSLGFGGPQVFGAMPAPAPPGAARMGVRMMKKAAAPMAMRMQRNVMSNEADLEMDSYSKPKPALEELGETKEYCESNYYEIPSIRGSRGLVQESEFWADYAEYYAKGEKKPFLTHQFVHAYHMLPEAIGALALLDLPYYSMDHGYKTLEGRSVELKAISNLIIFKKEIKESKEERSPNIVVAQKYIDWEYKGDEEANVEEFLVNHIYRGQVVVTNISSRRLECDVLVQIPEGSLPISNFAYHKSHPQNLDCDVPLKINYLFYFPKPGKFAHFPANVSINSVVVAKSNVQTLHVLAEKTKISEENFKEVLSTGNYDMILKFIKEKPIEGIKQFSWHDLYWLLKDPKFYEPFIAILKEQKRFDITTWSYSLYHKSREDLIAEYMNSLANLKRQCGYYLDSKLLKVRPVDSNLCHLDYYPLVNPRAHKNLTVRSSSNQPMILNESLYGTYKMWILYLIEKPVWSLADRINLVYYLLLQDRVPEATKVYSKVNVEEEVKKEDMLKLQCDYVAAYLDFYTGAPEFKTARRIVATYINYPIISWRLMFMDMDQQLKEYDGIKVDDDELAIEEEERKEVSKKKQIKSEPLLNVKLEGKEIIIDYDNIPEIAIKYYVIDLEVMFSRTPFLTQNSKEFSFIKPNSSETIKLDPKVKEYRMKIPEKYGLMNVLIEVNGAVIQQLVTYFATSLKLEIFENYGEIKVTDQTGKPMPQVYVKAFMKKNNDSVIFYKDGYTDIRGRFDYVSLNASQLAEAKKFALFVMSEKNGSLIRECQPPSTTIRPEDDLGPVKQRVFNYYNKQMQTKNVK